jgi:hypothetical protein
MASSGTALPFTFYIVCKVRTVLQYLYIFLSFVRFKVLTAMSMKMTVFWDVAPCSLLEVE